MKNNQKKADEIEREIRKKWGENCKNIMKFMKTCQEIPKIHTN